MLRNVFRFQRTIVLSQGLNFKCWLQWLFMLWYSVTSLSEEYANPFLLIPEVLYILHTATCRLARVLCFASYEKSFRVQDLTSYMYIYILLNTFKKWDIEACIWVPIFNSVKLRGSVCAEGDSLLILRKVPLGNLRKSQRTKRENTICYTKEKMCLRWIAKAFIVPVRRLVSSLSW